MCCLVEGYKENPGSCRYELGKGRCILIAFSDTGVYAILIVHQNSTRGSFLKASCNVQFETVINELLVPYKLRMYYFENSFDLADPLKRSQRTLPPSRVLWTTCLPLAYIVLLQSVI